MRDSGCFSKIVPRQVVPIQTKVRAKEEEQCDDCQIRRILHAVETLSHPYGFVQ